MSKANCVFTNNESAGFVPAADKPVDETKAMLNLLLSLKNVDTAEKFKIRKYYE